MHLGGGDWRRSPSSSAEISIWGDGAERFAEMSVLGREIECESARRWEEPAGRRRRAYGASVCPKVVDEGRGLKAPLWLDVRFTVGVRVRLRLDF